MAAIVAGRVQGVSFRAFVAEHGRALGLDGYARNRPDGTVEVLAEGDRSGLEELIALIRRGPRHARVDRVEVTWSEARGGLQGFDAL